MIVAVAVALTIVYIMLTTLVFPFFGNSYEYGFGSAPCNKDGTCTSAGLTNINNGYCATPSATVIACASCNITTGYSTFLSSCSSLISAMNGTHCYQCSSFGFKSVSTGLLLFVFVIGMVFFAVTFLKATKFGK